MNITSIENSFEEFALENPYVDAERIQNIHLRSNVPNTDSLMIFLFILGKCEVNLTNHHFGKQCNKVNLTRETTTCRLNEKTTITGRARLIRTRLIRSST